VLLALRVVTHKSTIKSAAKPVSFVERRRHSHFLGERHAASSCLLLCVVAPVRSTFPSLLQVALEHHPTHTADLLQDGALASFRFWRYWYVERGLGVYTFFLSHERVLTNVIAAIFNYQSCRCGGCFSRLLRVVWRYCSWYTLSVFTVHVFLLFS